MNHVGPGRPGGCALARPGVEGPERNPLDDLDLETATLEEGVEALAQAARFGTDRTGFGSDPDPGVIVLEEILRQPDAIAYLDRLWVHGTPAARLYAICGFYVADTARFEWTSRSLFGRTECVDYLDSCLGSRRNVVAALHSAAGSGLLERLRQRVHSRKSEGSGRTAAVETSDLSAAELAANDLSEWLACGAVVTTVSTGPAPWSCVQVAWGGLRLGQPVVGPDGVFVPLALGKHPRRRAHSFICVRGVTTKLEHRRVLVWMNNGSCGPGALDDLAAYFGRPSRGTYSLVYDDPSAGFPTLGEVTIE